MLHKKTQIELLFVKGGEFTMGSPKSEHGRQEEELQRRVVVSDFWIGKTEVTREQYARYLKDNPDAPKPMYWTDPRFSKAHQPMVGMSWEDAMAYVKWAGLRLPTEAEWEYAARAGTTSAYFSGETEADLKTVGWYDANSKDQPSEVAQKPANAFGLFDMHGNAWEWCSDFYGPYIADKVSDPVGPTSGTRRAVRGGSWDDPQLSARSAHRVGFAPTERFSQVGFRVALSAKPNQ
jgi:formylglycine-generating enzyme required for sulfatase activity